MLVLKFIIQTAYLGEGKNRALNLILNARRDSLKIFIIR